MYFLLIFNGKSENIFLTFQFITIQTAKNGVSIYGAPTKYIGLKYFCPYQEATPAIIAKISNKNRKLNNFLLLSLIFICKKSIFIFIHNFSNTIFKVICSIKESRLFTFRVYAIYQRYKTSSFKLGPLCSNIRLRPDIAHHCKVMLTCHPDSNIILYQSTPLYR